MPLPDVVLATQEPWGTYHARGLSKVAVGRLRLRQWCPSPEHLPADTEVQVTFDADDLRRADLVVVNGLDTEHTSAAIAIAEQAGVPLALTELAYLTDRPAGASGPQWRLVSCVSQATQPLVAAHAGCPASEVQVLGWQGHDHLPVRTPVARRLLALTSVSPHAPTGGDAGQANAQLYEALERCEAAGWDIEVRPHPREPHARWQRWELPVGLRLPEQLASAEVVLGVPGTSLTVAAAMGVPYVGIAGAVVPSYMHSLYQPLADPALAPALLAGARPLSACLVAQVCGPLGNSAERIISAWAAAAGQEL